MTKPRRICLYLDPKLGRELESLGKRPGTTMTQIVSDALRAHLNGNAADPLEQRFKQRLDRIGGQLNRIERDGRVILESLALFIRYQLTISNPLPESQLAALQAQGNKRFQTFIDEVGRRLAKGADLGAEIAQKVQVSP